MTTPEMVADVLQLSAAGLLLLVAGWLLVLAYGVATASPVEIAEATHPLGRGTPQETHVPSRPPRSRWR